MKKNIFSTIFTTTAVAATVAFAMTSCDKSQPSVEPATQSKAPAELKLAYVEVDSIMTQYNFAKEYSKVLEKKSQNIQATLNSKGQQLQQAAANFQQKVQQNAYTQQQAQAIQEGLQKQQADL